MIIRLSLKRSVKEKWVDLKNINRKEPEGKGKRRQLRILKGKRRQLRILKGRDLQKKKIK